MFTVQPVTLAGRWLRLEPMTAEHVDDLLPFLTDEEVHRYLPVAYRDRADLDLFAAQALAARDRGDEFPFVIIDQESNRPIGGTRLMDIRPAHHGVEIGHSFLGRAWWRTRANSEAKYLLLTHCFDTLGCIRVSLKTDGLNVRSQQAIERLGAVREGVLRRHMIVQGGRYRDTVYYSILDTEWPAIRTRMAAGLYGETA